MAVDYQHGMAFLIGKQNMQVQTVITVVVQEDSQKGGTALEHSSYTSVPVLSVVHQPSPQLSERVQWKMFYFSRCPQATRHAPFGQTTVEV